MVDHWSIEALKEYVDQRFASSEVAVTTALSSAEKAVGAALIAAEKAVEKAEAAQGRVNETQNEFRGTLRDQAADLMPRAETELLVKDLRPDRQFAGISGCDERRCWRACLADRCGAGRRRDRRIRLPRHPLKEAAVTLSSCSSSFSSCSSYVASKEKP